MEIRIWERFLREMQMKFLAITVLAMCCYAQDAAIGRSGPGWRANSEMASVAFENGQVLTSTALTPQGIITTFQALTAVYEVPAKDAAALKAAYDAMVKAETAFANTKSAASDALIAKYNLKASSVYDPFNFSKDFRLALPGGKLTDAIPYSNGQTWDGPACLNLGPDGLGEIGPCLVATPASIIVILDNIPLCPRNSPHPIRQQSRRSDTTKFQPRTRKLERER